MSDTLQDRFERARELAPAERARFLADLDSADPVLAAQLRALLDAAEQGDSPLDSSPWAAHGPPELDQLDEVDDLGGAAEEATALPESIGPYRVLSEIGRGGMGRVYLALQEGEGFARRLAVKVVAPEGSGPEIERRFREERRILAALEHPGIARFHDAGRDRDGRWYLALEYIDGAGLIEHARARNLSTEERLRLFLAVLEAVAFAHAHGVVHRDLKPANILVGSDGRPRLLDFGIAKFIDSEGAAATTQTRTTMRALTPAYASPEQFRGEAVTPASDVFSLGVLLYELLAGRRPFGGEGASQVALEREILETDPVPPSTASRQAGVHQGGGAGEVSPGRRLSRDLDAVCLKALRKNAKERYPSARELAADLERHLAGLPVIARGADRRYRAVRFLLRHRAASAVVAALAVAAGAVALAIVAARRSDPAVRAEPAPQPFRFGGITGKDVAALEAAFVATPGDVEAGARLALALELAGRGDEALLVVARLRQIPDHGTDPLIDYVEASVAATARQSQRALVLFGAALDRASASGRGDLVPQIRAARGRLLFTLGRREEALRDMESARASFERANDPASLARVLNDLAIDPLTNGRLAEGEALLEQALAASRAAGSSSAGVISMNLAMISLLRGFPDRAEFRLREAIATFQRSKSRRLGAAVLNLAMTLRDLGRREEAMTVLAEAFALLPSPADEGSLTYALRVRGDDELQSGRLAPAEATAGELEALAKSRGDRLTLGLSNRLRGEIAAARDDLAEARRRFGDARRQFLDHADGDEAEELDVVWAEGALRFGEPTEAGEIARRVRPDPAAEIEKTGQFVAEAILARLDAQEGRRDAAARRLELLAAKAAGSTSVRRQLALLRASAALAIATGSADAARRDLAAARDVAHNSGRLVEALELELEMADIDFTHGRAADGVASAGDVARRAQRLGLVQLSARAGLVAAQTAAREAGRSAP